MSGTRTYSDCVYRSVNGSEKKRNCSGKAEAEGEGADQWTECQTCLGGSQPCRRRHSSRSKVGSRHYLAMMWLTRVEIPIEAQKEKAHLLYSLSDCGAWCSSTLWFHNHHVLTDILSFFWWRHDPFLLVARMLICYDQIRFTVTFVRYNWWLYTLLPIYTSTTRRPFYTSTCVYCVLIKRIQCEYSRIPSDYTRLTW